jgi:hypothetical protein
MKKIVLILLIIISLPLTINFFDFIVTIILNIGRIIGTIFRRIYEINNI